GPPARHRHHRTRRRQDPPPQAAHHARTVHPGRAPPPTAPPSTLALAHRVPHHPRPAARHPTALLNAQSASRTHPRRPPQPHPTRPPPPPPPPAPTRAQLPPNPTQPPKTDADARAPTQHSFDGGSKLSYPASLPDAGHWGSLAQWPSKISRRV